MAENKKCAHVPCTCQTGEKYCSETCRDAGPEEVEIACECGHSACANEVNA